MSCVPDGFSSSGGARGDFFSSVFCRIRNGFALFSCFVFKAVVPKLGAGTPRGVV